MDSPIKRLRDMARLWKFRSKLPSWHRLDRSPRLTAEQLIQGISGFHPFVAAEKSRGSISLRPRPNSISRQERAWSEMTPQEIPELGCFVLRNTLCGGEGYLFHKNRIVYDPLLIPWEWRKLLWSDPYHAPMPREIRPRRWPRPLIYFMARDHINYGHWWLDILPRLFHLKKHQPSCFVQCDLAVPDNLPIWALTSLQELIGLNPDRFVSYDPKSSEYLLPPWILLPTMVHQSHHFHPAANEFYEHAIQWAQANVKSPLDRASRLFLSRGQQSNRPVVNRPLGNIEEIEHAFVQAGYTVLAPENFSWVEQIALFAQAEIVAGEHGSAMKNMIFARPGTVQIVINHLNINQATIAALRRQPCLIHRGIGFKHSRSHKPYRCDLSAIRKSIHWAENYRRQLSASPNTA